ncbi:hypothetical protein [Pantoea dispersa]|uniref:hypothetical protein n=1 Tax=Pantoea dispersa TaxID=59814 RepID=UPI0039B5F262
MRQGGLLPEKDAGMTGYFSRVTHLCQIALLGRIHRHDLVDLLDRIAATPLAGPLTGQRLVSLINYLVQAGETDDAEDFITNLAQRVPQHEDELMTIAQQLEQKGREKGRMDGKMEVARNLLAKGIPPEPVRVISASVVTE